jgi:hypothetical protein
MDDVTRNELDLLWSENVGASIVDELLVAKLIREDQAEWARRIVAQDIHIKLISGYRPPISN